MQLIARNNNFPQNLLHKLNRQMQHQKKKINHIQTEELNKNKTWTTFTYYSPKIRKTTNLFKNTNVGIAFKNTYTLKQLTHPKTNNKTPEHDKSGIYNISRNTCHRSYIRQTSRTIKQRFQEHTRYIKHNEPQSAYTLHILNNKHEHGPIKDSMTLLKHIEKPSLLIPYEQLNIQSYHRNNQLIPEQHSNEQNPVYQLIYNRHNTSHPTWPLDQYLNSNTTKPVPFQPGQQSTKKVCPTNNLRTNLLHFLKYLCLTINL